MKSHEEALFLHWGPGGHTEVERAWFEGQVPIHWWDQPKFEMNDLEAFRKLVDAAEKELERLYSRTRKPVSVIGHSFGGQIALDLSRRTPEKIREIRLLAASPWPPRAFIGLAQKLVPSSPAIAAAEKKLTVDVFWNLVQSIMEFGDFMSAYWGPRSSNAQQKFETFVKQCSPLLDFPSCTAVMNSFMAQPEGLEASPFSGQVRIFMGESDPLQDISHDTARWKRLFPQSEVRVLDAGHFIHLEAPISSWLSE